MSSSSLVGIYSIIEDDVTGSFTEGVTFSIDPLAAVAEAIIDVFVAIAMVVVLCVEGEDFLKS